jgi:Mce-associated membrane protein
MTTTADTTRESVDETSLPEAPRSGRRRYAVAAGVVVVAAAVAFGGWQLYEARHELSTMRADAGNREHAEQVALDYATAAAQMDFKDLGTWKDRLTAGTAPELRDRLTQAATSMEQIVVPLQWSSTAQPIAAKATPGENGVYTVDCFVSVFTSNAQAPEGIQSTATYKLSIDSTDDWVITEISGIGPEAGGGDPAPR